MTATEYDDPSATIAEYERLAYATGEFGGQEVAFSNDGATWASFCLPTDENPHPRLARATVHRKGVDVPRTVVIGWDEALPEGDEWRDLWDRKPHVFFGAAAARAGFRSAFRDVIERAERTERPAPAEQPKRNWVGDIAAATTKEAVHEIHAAIRRARQMTDPLDGVAKARLVELEQVAAAKAAPKPHAPKAPLPTAVAAAMDEARQRARGGRNA